MQRITDRTVELTRVELAMSNIFDRLLDQGHSIPEAVTYLRSQVTTRSILTDEFWEYLSS